MRRRWYRDFGWETGSLFIAAAALVFAASLAAQQAPKSTPNNGTARAPVAGKKATFKGVFKEIMDSEDALGMLRSVDEIDAINTMEFWSSGVINEGGTQYKAEYHVNLGYNPPGYRLEITRTKAGAKPETTLEVVNDKYAWNESELGAGLIPGKGVATPVPNAYKQRLLQLWILPYGALKAAVNAGDQTKVSTEGGVKVFTFPMAAPFEGLTAKITLDSKLMPASVDTMSSDPSLHDLVIHATYSNYGDYGEAASDLYFPKRIVETRDGHPYLDLTVSKDDPYDPYEMFRTPPAVSQAAGGH